MILNVEQMQSVSETLRPLEERRREIVATFIHEATMAWFKAQKQLDAIAPGPEVFQGPQANALAAEAKALLYDRARFPFILGRLANKFGIRRHEQEFIDQQMAGAKDAEGRLHKISGEILGEPISSEKVFPQTPCQKTLAAAGHCGHAARPTAAERLAKEVKKTTFDPHRAPEFCMQGGFIFD